MTRNAHIGRGSARGPKNSSEGASSSSRTTNSKPTHFLCFPIASPSTVPLISSSLSHWMDVTTRPKWKAPCSKQRRLPPKPDTQANGDMNGSDVQATSTQNDESIPNSQRPTTDTLAERLQVLPPVVTRAAGTWHLTLGVMDLSRNEQMEKALDVLRALDLQDLLHQAESGPPAGLKSARRWKDDTLGTETEDPNKPSTEIPSDPTSVTIPELGPVTQPNPLVISLSGLGGFPSLSKARVLWARPRERHISPVDSDPNIPKSTPPLQAQDRLYNFSLHLIQPFRDAGLITETRGLALHATIANMRFAKNRGQTPGWKADRVDARGIGRVWNSYEGDLTRAEAEGGDDSQDGGENGEGDEDGDKDGEDGEIDHRDRDIGGGEGEFVWLRDVELDRVAICKLGASQHQDPVWREWYPPVEGGERFIFGS